MARKRLAEADESPTTQLVQISQECRLRLNPRPILLDDLSTSAVPTDMERIAPFGRAPNEDAIRYGTTSTPDDLSAHKRPFSSGSSRAQSMAMGVVRPRLFLRLASPSETNRNS